MKLMNNITGGYQALPEEMLKAAVHRLAHVPCNSVQDKFVGPTLNSKSRTVEQSSSILRFSTSSAALTGLFLLLDY